MEQALQLAQDAALARSAARFAASRSFTTARGLSSAAARFGSAAGFSRTTARGFATARSFAAAAAVVAMEQALQAAQQTAAGAAAARIAADGFAADRLAANGFAAATAAATEQAHATERTGVGREGAQTDDRQRDTTEHLNTLLKNGGRGNTYEPHTVRRRGHGPTQGFAASSTSSDLITGGSDSTPAGDRYRRPNRTDFTNRAIFLKFPRFPVRNNPRMLAAPAERD